MIEIFEWSGTNVAQGNIVAKENILEARHLIKTGRYVENRVSRPFVNKARTLEKRLIKLLEDYQIMAKFCQLGVGLGKIEAFFLLLTKKQ